MVLTVPYARTCIRQKTLRIRTSAVITKRSLVITRSASYRSVRHGHARYYPACGLTVKTCPSRSSSTRRVWHRSISMPRPVPRSWESPPTSCRVTPRLRRGIGRSYGTPSLISYVSCSFDAKMPSTTPTCTSIVAIFDEREYGPVPSRTSLSQSHQQSARSHVRISLSHTRVTLLVVRTSWHCICTTLSGAYGVCLAIGSGTASSSLWSIL